MTIITITRHYNGFVNVADTYEVGNHEHEGNAAASNYVLPEGYTVSNGMIYDPAGYQCEVFGDERGVFLMSLAGPCRSEPILTEV